MTRTKLEIGSLMSIIGVSIRRTSMMVLLSGSGCMTSHLMMLSGKILMLRNEAFDSDIGEKQL